LGRRILTIPLIRGPGGVEAEPAPVLAAEAAQVALGLWPDVVLMDLRMPEVDGSVVAVAFSIV
jgi:CheY-like chemotaxis protein